MLAWNVLLRAMASSPGAHAHPGDNHRSQYDKCPKGDDDRVAHGRADCTQGTAGNQHRTGTAQHER